MRTLVILSLHLAAAFVLACSAALETESIQGTWYLHVYNDSAVPGTAEFRAGGVTELIEIDSVRLYLGGESDCGWLVHLATQAPNQATSCVWSQNEGPDDIVITIDEGFVLRGDVLSAMLRLQDPNGNVLRFEREPAVREPEEPVPL